MSDLPSDQYYIRNKDDFAGRSKFEDASLLPKKVYCPTDQQLWGIERLSNGRYKISVGGAPTKEIKNLLYALVYDEAPDEWIITWRGEEDHRQLYTIEKVDGQCWVRQIDVADPQIAVRYALVAPSEPPQYEGGALWNIQPLVG